MVFAFSFLLAVVGAMWNPKMDFHPSAEARVPSEEPVSFDRALPIWAEGREKETNALFGFRADFTIGASARPVLQIAAATVYRVYVNGRFVGHGPVRAPHGYVRGDQWPLNEVIKEGRNAIAIEVSNYNVPVFSGNGLQSGFLQAEVSLDGKVICATGRDFSVIELPRVRNTSRLTPQRSFVEMCRLSPEWDAWRTAADSKGAAPALCRAMKILPRIAPYPRFDVVRPRDFARTEFSFDAVTPPRRRELAYDGHDELSRLRDVKVIQSQGSEGLVDLGHGLVADFGRVDAGFLGCEITCDGPCKVYLVWDEILTDGIPDPMRHWNHDMSSVWELTAAGKYRIEMMEPTAARYVHLFAREGSARVGGIYLREYKNPLAFAAEFECSDERVNRVFAAARDTCSQCTMDACLDNPDRERNSGPCDSFYTLGGYATLSGDYRIERLLFDNYAIPRRYPQVGNAMVPWCYPADFASSEAAVIPQYVAWFILQLERYTVESGDKTYCDALRERLLRIHEEFCKFRNSDGLLEGMPGGHLGWSMATSFDKDVNYPSNALWSEALDALSRLYGRAELHDEAEGIRKTVRKQSFNGEWFRDCACRNEGGVLTTCDDISETCQYYMLKFGVASLSREASYWEEAVYRLGRLSPGYGKALGKIHPSNYFQGLMLRHVLLTNSGLHREALREIGYLVDMADVTGTLWEGYPGIYHGVVAKWVYSCCQGFTSYAATLIVRSALGLERMDRVARKVKFRVPDNGLRFCHCTLPTEDGPFTVDWRRDGEQVLEDVKLPTGWERIN